MELLFWLCVTAFVLWRIQIAGRRSAAVALAPSPISQQPDGSYAKQIDYDDEDDEQDLTEVAAVGESNYVDVVAELLQGKVPLGPFRYTTEVDVTPEDSNPHDPKAIAVQLEGRTIGYLDRSTARAWRKHCKVTKTPLTRRVDGLLIGHYPEGYGIWLDLPADLDV